jgi:hypothetical protein
MDDVQRRQPLGGAYKSARVEERRALLPYPITTPCRQIQQPSVLHRSNRRYAPDYTLPHNGLSRLRVTAGRRHHLPGSIPLCTPGPSQSGVRLVTSRRPVADTRPQVSTSVEALKRYGHGCNARAILLPAPLVNSVWCALLRSMPASLPSAIDRSLRGTGSAACARPSLPKRECSSDPRWSVSAGRVCLKCDPDETST